ncbi:flagellar export protein FliJ [Candidatus Magnetobacterium casense]|uniref:Flagellar export protein FliJ n=1 Tax=Candidatus Magnetobacterium casense TaxID=1455061 RepID=A0ABS6RU44_9BACT|nr:flagellar export protein FliJ [Candidatus Magnetobacterium casensis]MBV6340142.1 flagellar export protein FliJ [Candidatus Magnetobacterium casensis]
MANVKTLERLQQIRQYKTDEIEAEFKKILIALMQQEDILNTLHVNLNRLTTQMNEKQTRGFRNAYELSLFYDYMETLNRLIQKQQELVRQMTLVFEEKKAELLEAYKEVKVVEKLKNKVIADKNKTAAWQEQKELDYVYLSRLPRY